MLVDYSAAAALAFAGQMGRGRRARAAGAGPARAHAGLRDDPRYLVAAGLAAGWAGAARCRVRGCTPPPGVGPFAGRHRCSAARPEPAGRRRRPVRSPPGCLCLRRRGGRARHRTRLRRRRLDRPGAAGVGARRPRVPRAGAGGAACGAPAAGTGRDGRQRRCMSSWWRRSARCAPATCRGWSPCWSTGSRSTVGASHAATIRSRWRRTWWRPTSGWVDETTRVDIAARHAELHRDSRRPRHPRPRRIDSPG